MRLEPVLSGGRCDWGWAGGETGYKGAQADLGVMVASIILINVMDSQVCACQNYSDCTAQIFPAYCTAVLLEHSGAGFLPEAAGLCARLTCSRSRAAAWGHGCLVT